MVEIHQSIPDLAPTLEIYVRGEFIGGCDIVTEMSETGELSELLAGV